MTVSSSVGARETIEQICLTAYQGIGLRSTQQGTDDLQWQADFAFAKKMLNSLLNELAVYGVMAHAIEFETISISAADVTAETYKYSLSATALDVIGDGVWIDSSQTDLDRADGETIIKLINAEQWHTLSSHGAVGRPQLAYPHRNATPIQLWLWQIPSEAGAMRFPVQRKLADTNDGAATIDLEEFWLEWVYVALQHKLSRAKTLPISVQMDLARDAAGKLEWARGQAREHAPPMLTLDHPTGWRR